MREIIFRGKSIGTAEWVEGFYCGGNERKTLRPCIFVYIPDRQSYDCQDIIPETVGQYTGLKDIHGVKIFEGDIVKLTINRDYIFSVDWVNDCGMYCLKCLNRHPKHNFEALDTDFTVFNGDETEIIGNIHDNPELLA